MKFPHVHLHLGKYREQAHKLSTQLNPVWALTTFYLLIFFAGIVIGELYCDFGRIAIITNIVSTLTVLVLGLDVIWRSWHKNSLILITSSALILANFMDFAQFFDPPVTRIFFHVSTSVAAVFLFYIVHVKKVIDS